MPSAADSLADLARTLRPDQRMSVCARALVDLRTLRRLRKGRPIRETSRIRLANAFRELGLLEAQTTR